MRFLATLFGIVMLSHQIGGFLGAWLGGKMFEATGGYEWMWYADVMLAFAAALIHPPINAAPRFRSAAAAARAAPARSASSRRRACRRSRASRRPAQPR